MATKNLHLTNGSLISASRKLSADLTKGISNNVLPTISQLFKDTLLFSGPEMEMMALFLTDHVKTAATAVQAAALYARDQFKPKPAPCIGDNTFGNMQPCI